MAAYAFTNIKHEGKTIPAGTRITSSMFPKDVIETLKASGAIVGYNRLEVENPSPPEIEEEEEEPQNSQQEGD